MEELPAVNDLRVRIVYGYRLSAFVTRDFMDDLDSERHLNTATYEDWWKENAVNNFSSIRMSRKHDHATYRLAKIAYMLLQLHEDIVALCIGQAVACETRSVSYVYTGRYR